MRISCVLGVLIAASAPTSATRLAEHVPAALVATSPHGAVVLRGDGVATKAGTIAFGVAQAHVVEQLIAAFASEPSQRDLLTDCGSGADAIVSWDNGFAAYFDDARFVGWMAVDQRTAVGIGFGSTRAQLDGAYDAQIEESSLGMEFSVDGLSGVLESDSPDAVISAFWAGDACVMR